MIEPPYFARLYRRSFLALLPSAGCGLRLQMPARNSRSKRPMLNGAPQLTPQQYEILRQQGTERPGFEPTAQGASQGYLRLRRVRPAAVSPRRRNSKAAPVGQVFYQPLENAVGKTEDRTLRDVAPPKFTAAVCGGPSRSPLRRRAEADRPALLHGRLCACIPSGPGHRRPDCSIHRPAIVARPAIVPRSSDRGFFI